MRVFFLLMAAAAAAELRVSVSAAWGGDGDVEQVSRRAFEELVHPADPALFERAFELLNAAGYFAPKAAAASAASSNDERVLLGGYGVELDIKNTEYLVLNDDDAVVNDDEKKFKLPEASADLAELVGNACLMGKSSLEKLKNIVEISSDFPQRVLEGLLDSNPPKGAFSRDFPPDSVMIENDTMFVSPKVLNNPFRLMREIVQAAVRTEMISKAFSTGEFVGDISTSSKRVDVRLDSKNAIAFLNNLETEKRYADWPKAYPNQHETDGEMRVAQISRNLFTLICVVDPSLHDLRMPLYLVQAGAPVRVGLVFVDAVGGGSAAASTRCGAECITKLYVATIKHGNSRKVAMQLLGQLGSSTSVKIAIATFDALNPTSQMSGIEVLSSEIGNETFEKMKTYAEKRNFSPNSFSFNGAVFEDVSTLERKFMRLMQNEQNELRRLDLLPTATRDVENPLKSVLEAFDAVSQKERFVLEKFLPLTEATIDAVEGECDDVDCPARVIWVWKGSAFENSPVVSAVVDKDELWYVLTKNNPKYSKANYEKAQEMVFVDGRVVYLDEKNVANFDLEEFVERLPIAKKSRTAMAAATSCAFFYESPLTDRAPRGKRVGLTFVADPLSQITQRVAPVILSMADLLDLDVRVNPSTTAPLQSFYRYAADRSELIKFSSLAKVFRKTVLTVKLVTAESWLVLENNENDADADPDNLVLNDENVSLNYDLKYTLVSGRAKFEDSDENDDDVPDGLSLVLDENADETVVMRNLGFFQLRTSKPGRHSISSECASAVADSTDFTNDWITLRVPRKSFNELFGADRSKQITFKTTETSPGDTLHVFSLASGKLYERFLRVMMLSAVKRTNSKLKFWLLETFLSKNFRESLPRLAKKAGFEFAFVSTKWPDWLRGQTEKQRLIWGYKILFLDVLFPQSVEKIVYVDADQVVRADLRELFDLDLSGDPIAMVPFCRGELARQDTKGFRFWDSGFWEKHLRGRPYHISALFVVDLKQFRARSVGDQYRAVYQQLSADPNSLSNLDQDLPNFASTNIPLHSLPQEWLFCESWCVKDFLAKAKTIDLCNNPMVKEPKLKMARRIVKRPDFQESWDELDEEVERMLSGAGESE